jgi:cell division protein FtsW
MKLATTAIVFCVCALVLLGLVSLYSAGMAGGNAAKLGPQAVWLGIGVVACIAFTFLDYRVLARMAWVIVPVTLLLLLLVLIPGVGQKINGARRWLNFGGFNVQPSELAKLALIIGLAAYCQWQQRRMGEFKRGLLIPGAGAAALLGLVLLEPDFGTAMLLAAVAGSMLVIAGVRLRYIAPIALVGLVAFTLLVLANANRSERIDAWLNPEQHKDGLGYQAYQAMLALGRGGVTGVGLGDSRQKLGFIPEHHTDFILAVIGEEFGLAGTLPLLLVFAVLVAAMLAVARCAADPFGFYLACGIAFLIGLQAFINIGVVTSVLPNKGMALPFVSYGGSSLVIMLSAVGMVLSVARRGEAPVKTKRAGRKTSKETGKSNPFSSGNPEAQFS